MSLARDIADLGAVTSRLDTVGASSGALSNKNIIINGAMRVAQRGTSFSGTTGLIQILDRWQAPVGSGFNLDTTITQSTTVPTGEGFMNSLKVEADSVVTPSGGDNGGIGTKLEGNDVKHLAYGSSSAKSVTLSFWVRSNKTGIYCCQFQTNQASGNSDQYSHVKEYTISSADTWEKKTLTFPGLTAAAITSTNTDGLRVIWWLACGSSDHVAADTWAALASYAATSNQVNFMDSASNEWYLTGVQLEVGTATDFEHEPYSVTLAKAQRYYFQETTTATDASGILGVASGAATVVFNQSLPVQMRTKPSVSLTSTNLRIGDTVAAGFTTTSGTIAIQSYSGSASVTYTLGGFSGLTSYRTYLHEPDGTSTGYVKFDAEL